MNGRLAILLFNKHRFEGGLFPQLRTLKKKSAKGFYFHSTEMSSTKLDNIGVYRNGERVGTILVSQLHQGYGG